MVIGNCEINPLNINYYVTAANLSEALNLIQQGQISDKESLGRVMHRGVEFLEHAHEGSFRDRQSSESHPSRIVWLTLRGLKKIPQGYNIQDIQAKFEKVIIDFAVKLSLLECMIEDNDPDLSAYPYLGELNEFFQKMAELESKRMPEQTGCFG